MVNWSPFVMVKQEEWLYWEASMPVYINWLFGTIKDAVVSPAKFMWNFIIFIPQNQQKLLSQTSEFACPSFSFRIIINNIKMISYYMLKIMWQLHASIQCMNSAI